MFIIITALPSREKNCCIIFLIIRNVRYADGPVFFFLVCTLDRLQPEVHHAPVPCSTWTQRTSWILHAR